MQQELPLFKYEAEEQPVKAVSGYRIYAPEQSRRTMHNELPDFYPDFPDEK